MGGYSHKNFIHRYSVCLLSSRFWHGDALVYRRLCPLEQLLRNDGIRSLGNRFGRDYFWQEKHHHHGIGNAFRRDHSICFRTELDGPANRNPGTCVEIALAYVSCGNYRGGLWVFRHWLFIGHC